MATFVTRATVKRDLSVILGLSRQQDGTYGTVAGYLIAEDTRHGMAEMGMVIARLPGLGLMRARDYTALLDGLQQARVVFRRAGRQGNPNNIFNPWGDRIFRIAAWPLRDVARRVGDLRPGSALVTAPTHHRIVRIVGEAWSYGLNGAAHNQWQPLI